jgi:uncharacterized protein (DUF1697 family)
MERIVGLLRGVNVGGRNLVPMAELRAQLAALGLGEVLTYIQSGNVVFSAEQRPSETELATLIAERFGVQTTVVLRSAAELEAVLAANPFPAAASAGVHVGFMPAPPAPARVQALEQDRFLPDRFVLSGADVYVWLGSGVGRATLPAYLDRRLGQPLTLRNWATVTRLVELARA